MISESLLVEDTVTELIQQGGHASQLRGEIPVSMLHDGLSKAAGGATTLDEILRVLEAM